MRRFFAPLFALLLFVGACSSDAATDTAVETEASDAPADEELAVEAEQADEQVDDGSEAPEELAESADPDSNFCQVVAENDSLFADFDLGLGGVLDAEAFRQRVAPIIDASPDAIRPDIEAAFGGIATLLEALQDIDIDDQAAAEAAFAEHADEFEIVSEAGPRIDAYIEAECGIIDAFDN